MPEPGKSNPPARQVPTPGARGDDGGSGVQAIVGTSPRALALRLSERHPGAEDVLRHFLESLSPNTLRAYRADLGLFARWLGLPGARELAPALFGMPGPRANELVLEWRNSMQQAAVSSATIARRLSALRSLVEMGQTLGLVEWSIRIKRPRVQRYKDVRGPGVAAIHRLYAACGRGLIGARDRAIVGLIAGHGLRRGEVARLRSADYDRDRGLLRVVGKGEKESTLTLAPEVAELLKAWTIAAGIASDESLFHSLSRRSRRAPLTGDAVWSIVRRLGEKAGVHTWPHAIRHTSITTVATETRDPFVTREFARHESVQTTQRYIDSAMDQTGEAARRAAAVLIPKS